MYGKTCGRIVLPLMLAVMVLVSSTAWSQAPRAQSPDLRTLTAVGNAEVRVRPDLVEVRLGVETEAPTAEEARSENARIAQQVIQSIRALGIPETAIQTATFQVFPIRRWEDPTLPPTPRGEPPIVGYRVVNVVSVRTENLDLAPRIIDTAITAGANRVEDVRFLLRDETIPMQRALRQAVSNARQNARAMASELGVRLVRVQSVTEGGGVVTPPPVFFRGAVMEAAAPTPILPGEITVNAFVTLTYLIQ